jgi:SAM-dependent methyltransferase
MRIFDFGSNWQDFSEQRLSFERINLAAGSLQSLLQRDSLISTDFLDIGCGSGLFSLAAYQLGASRVIGIDVNSRCVSVSNRNRDLFAPNAPIIFIEDSILNKEIPDKLGQFSIVYAWGSLHHTGSMWEAIHNAEKLVKPGGILVLAIYNEHFTSPLWGLIKKSYNHLPGLGRKIMAMTFAGVIYLAKFLVTRRNPVEKERGMDFWYDVIDWIGGYPYEYSTPQKIRSALEADGFKLQRFLPATVPTGCNEFVFEKLVD